VKKYEPRNTRKNKEIASEHKAQVFNYLKATNLRLGLIVNFGHYPMAKS